MSINTWTGSKDIPCNATMNTNYDQCVYQNLRKIIFSEYNCTIPFLPDIRSSRSDAQYEKVCNDPRKRMDAYERYDLLKRNNENKLCENPCSSIRTYFGLFFKDPTYEEKDRAYLKIYLQSMTTIMLTVMDYDGVAMVADIGGYTGLLLGMSAIHLSRFLFKSILKALKAPRRKNKDQFTSQNQDTCKNNIDGMA